MGANINTGPNITIGNAYPLQNSNPDAGPDLSHQGQGVTDPRQVLSCGQAPNYWKIYGLYQNPQITLVDGFPQTPAAAGVASNASGLVAPANGSSINFPLVNSNANLGFNVNVPVVGSVTTRNSSGFGISSAQQAYAAANVTNCLALDLGPVIFTLPATGTTTPTALTAATSPGAVIPSSQAGISFPANQILTVLAQSTTNWKNPLKFYTPGTFVVVPGAGNAGGTTCLVAQIVALDYVQGFMVLNTPVLNSSSNATGVGVSNADSNGVSVWPYTHGGATAVFDPAHMVARNLSVVSSNAGDTSFVIQVVGFDVWGQPMTENITTNGTTIVLGKKAWKYIASANISKAGGGTTAGTITIGTAATTTGLFGFPLYVDQFEYLSIFVNGAYVTANTGFTAGLTFTTNPATFTTVDNRGTYAMQTAPSGAVHLALYMNVPQYQTILSNNLSYNQLFGLTQT